MKKSTLLLLGAAAVLGAVVLLTRGGGEAPLGKELSIEGYATAAQLEEDKSRKLLDGPLEIDHEIDEIELIQPEQTIHLVREGEGKETTWKLTEPIDGVAVKYLVEKICALFKTDTASAFSATTKESELGYYDLEPERRIGLVLKSKGAIYRGVDLWIGAAVEPDEAGPGGGGESDTWVMRRDDPTTVYRVVGKDLRGPVAAKLDTLRDKRVLSTKAEDIVGVEITSPEGEEIVLTGTRTEVPAEGAADKAGDDKSEPKPPKIEVSWALTKPAGVTGDASMSSVARSLSNLRAQEFVPEAKAPKGALGERPWKIVAKVYEGEPITVLVAAGDQGDIWARVEGRPEYFKLNQYAAKNLRKTVADLRDKTVVKVDKGAVIGLTLQGEGAGEALRLRKQGDAWRFEAPEVSFAADPSGILPSLSRISAVRWARPDEVAAARTALAKPELRGAIKTATAEHRLTFSAKLEGKGDLAGKRWGVLGDPASAEPFLIGDYTAKRFETTVDKLRLKKLFPGREQDDLQRLSVTLPGVDKPVVLERPSTGGPLTLAEVPEGKTVQAGPIRTMAATFVALSVKAFQSGKPASDVGLGGDKGARIVGRFSDGAEVTVRISDEKEGDAPYATVDGGPLKGEVFTLNPYQAKNLKKRLEDLVK